MKRLRKAIIAVGLFAATASLSAPASAVANPGAIDWDAPPAAFVGSLYAGVFGRTPESAAVVGGWAASVTSNPTSRLTVFRGFINSPEYRRRFGSTRGNWTLGYRVRGNTTTWAAYSGFNANYTGHTSGISSGYARALVGYYNTYASRR